MSVPDTRIPAWKRRASAGDTRPWAHLSSNPCAPVWHAVASLAPRGTPDGRGAMTKQPTVPGRNGSDTWEGPHVTETIDSTTAAPEASNDAPKKRGGGLNSMLIADLKSMAAGMGIAGAGSLKKAQLGDANKAAQSPAS